MKLKFLLLTTFLFSTNSLFAMLPDTKEADEPRNTCCIQMAARGDFDPLQDALINIVDLLPLKDTNAMCCTSIAMYNFFQEPLGGQALFKKPRSFSLITDFEAHMGKNKWGAHCASITLLDEENALTAKTFYHNNLEIINFCSHIDELRISTTSCCLDGTIDIFLQGCLMQNPQIKLQYFSWYGTDKNQPMGGYVTEDLKTKYQENHGDQVSFDRVD